MEEEREELDQVVVDIPLLLLHTDDVGRVERFGFVPLHGLVKWEEAKLEEVFYHYGDLCVRKDYLEKEQHEMKICTGTH